MRFSAAAVMAGLLLLSACTEAKKVWMVVELKMPDGKTAQMSFDNPAVPDMTLDECRGSLKSAVPTLMQGIQSQPQTAKSEYLGATCVASTEDPIKPK